MLKIPQWYSGTQSLLVFLFFGVGGGGAGGGSFLFDNSIIRGWGIETPETP